MDKINPVLPVTNKNFHLVLIGMFLQIQTAKGIENLQGTAFSIVFFKSDKK